MRGAHVKTTTLRSVRYDAAKRVLEVELGPGDVHRYFEVPPGVYAELTAAQSREQYFDRLIRLRFRHQRVLQI